MKRSSLATAFLLLSVLALVAFVVVVFNQTAQVVASARTFNETFGAVVLWAFFTVYGTLILIPVWMLARLPKPLEPPSNATGPEFDLYLKALGKRLAANPHLEGENPETPDQIRRALEVLAHRSDAVIRDAATAVFLTTATYRYSRT